MSTICDTILSFPGLEDTEEAMLNRVMALRGLEGSREYSVDLDSTVCLAAADIYKEMAATPDFTEGKLSKQYPRSYFERAAKRLYQENGEPENAAKIGKKLVIMGNASSRW